MVELLPVPHPLPLVLPKRRLLEHSPVNLHVDPHLRVFPREPDPPQ